MEEALSALGCVVCIGVYVGRIGVYGVGTETLFSTQNRGQTLHPGFIYCISVLQNNPMKDN